MVHFCVGDRERYSEIEKMSVCNRDTVRQRKTENHRERELTFNGVGFLILTAHP